MADKSGYRMDAVIQQPGHQHGNGSSNVANNGQAASPTEVQFMEKPQGIPNCPLGMEYLTMLDQLIIKQQVELLEVITGFETKNRYRIFNSLGQQAYFAQEESTCLQRQCCGGGRGFTMRITDNANQDVIVIERRFKCCAGCCWCANTDCCSMELVVNDARGQVLGYVKQRQSCWVPHYVLYDSNMQEAGRIRGICSKMCCPCCRDVPFPITTPDESTQIGEICKQWTGIVKEAFTDADTFSVTFPLDMDVRLKGVFVGAAFLIDFMFFEKSGNNN